MKEPDDLGDLIGEEISPDELVRLERVDALLRSVPAPPAEVPSTLTHAVDRIGLERPAWTRRRLALVVALAVAIAAAAFGLGRWTDDGEFQARTTFPMQATEAAPQAAAVISVGERDEESGNWGLELEISGLPKLPAGRYYHLWLAKDGKYGATCGWFNVGPGTTRVVMTVSYRLKDFDAWVLTAEGGAGDKPPPWLLRAEIRA